MLERVGEQFVGGQGHRNRLGLGQPPARGFFALHRKVDGAAECALHRLSHCLEQARQFYRRYGRWSLLLSWVPVIGDPLTVVAGVMREPWWSFLAIVTLAKAGRYLALVLATLGYLG